MFRLKKEMTDPCNPIRTLWADQAGQTPGPQQGWLMSHIQQCPRCQARLQGHNRVSLGLALLKSQRHSVDLLACANRQTLRYLKNHVRQTAHAVALSQIMPQPGLWGRLHRAGHSLANTAACLTAVIVLKTGMFNSFDRFGRDGEATMKGYYARTLDRDSQTYRDLFQG